MDALRQWWHDVAAPKVHKARWFLAIWVVLALVAIPWGVRAEERSLEADSVAALAEAGVTVEDITFTGRTAVVTGELTAEERESAEEALDAIGGIRSIEWRVETVSAPPSVTTPPPPTTTTTVPPGDPAVLELKVNLGRLTLRGELPDARRVALLGSAAEMVYGAGAVNRLSVGDVVDPPWMGGADRLVTSLGLVSAADIMLDGAGIAGNAQVPTPSAAEALEAVLADMGTGDFRVDVDIQVSEGDAATLWIVADGDTVTIEGALQRRKMIEALVELLVSLDIGEVVEDVELDKSLDPSFALTRVDELIDLLSVGDEWSLAYEDEVLSGERMGSGLFFRDPSRATVAAFRLLDEIASHMVGDPRLLLTIEVGGAVSDDGAVDIESAGKRAAAIADALMRMGVDPDRVTAAGIDEGEVLRFSLEPAER